MHIICAPQAKSFEVTVLTRAIVGLRPVLCRSVILRSREITGLRPGQCSYKGEYQGTRVGEALLFHTLWSKECFPPIFSKGGLFSPHFLQDFRVSVEYSVFRVIFPFFQPIME